MNNILEEYNKAKLTYGDAIILFKMGDFYEAFGDDAKLLAKELGLTVMRRYQVPMAGFPYHQLESYIKKLAINGLAVKVVGSYGPLGKRRIQNEDDNC